MAGNDGAKKAVRNPDQIEVRAAELVLRSTHLDDLDRYPDYSSAETYWASNELLKFLGTYSIR